MSRKKIDERLHPGKDEYVPVKKFGSCFYGTVLVKANLNLFDIQAKYGDVLGIEEVKKCLIEIAA